MHTSQAYKRFHSVPIYVEWAPAALLLGPAPAAPQKKAAGKKAKATAEDLVEGEGGGRAAAEEEDDEGRILYVKNLAFATTDAALRKHFESAAKARGAALKPCSHRSLSPAVIQLCPPQLPCAGSVVSAGAASGELWC